MWLDWRVYRTQLKGRESLAPEDAWGTHARTEERGLGSRSLCRVEKGRRAGLEVRLGTLGWDRLHLGVLWIEEFISIRYYFLNWMVLDTRLTLCA